jgi:uncharacterized protein (DUF2267 family)
MWELASERPQDLVMTFEILEMQQEYNMRKTNQLNKKKIKHANNVVEKQNNVQNSNDDETYEDIFQIMFDKIKKNLNSIITEEFKNLENLSFSNIEEKENNDKTATIANTTTTTIAATSIVTETLMSSDRILQKICFFKDEVIPCMPPVYKPLETFVELFENQLQTHIDKLVHNLSKLQVSEILDFINWIERYQYTFIEEFNYQDRQQFQSLSNIKLELLSEYKVRIKVQIGIWFVNINNQESEIVKDFDDTLITSHPEDMFNILHIQLEVAKEKLPKEYSKDVAITCLQVLQDMQRTNFDSLSNDWKNMDVTKMCAIINDNQRMATKCDEFKKRLLSIVENDVEKETLADILDEVSKQYCELANKSLNFLAKFFFYYYFIFMFYLELRFFLNDFIYTHICIILWSKLKLFL